MVTGQRQRFDELDGYRGLAALAIVLFHASLAYGPAHRPYAGTPLAAPIAYGWTGVGWFFALSGFVIFLPFARAAVAGAPAPPIVPYLRRRALRVLPLYYVVLLVAWLCGLADGYIGWRDLLAHLTLTQIWGSYRLDTLVAPAWSLAVEASFYLSVAALGPAVCRYCRRLPRERARVTFLAAILAGLGAASVAAKWGAALAGWSAAPLAPNTPLAALDALSLGMGLAVVVAATHGRPLVGRRGALALRLAGVGVAVAYLVLPDPVLAWRAVAYGPAALGMTLVMASTVLAPVGSRWARALGARPARALGDLSYGVYLWHYALLVGAVRVGLLFRAPADFIPALLALLALTLAVAALTFRYVERPAMRLARRPAPDRRLQPARRVAWLWRSRSA